MYLQRVSLLYKAHLIVLARRIIPLLLLIGCADGMELQSDGAMLADDTGGASTEGSDNGDAGGSDTGDAGDTSGDDGQAESGCTIDDLSWVAQVRADNGGYPGEADEDVSSSSSSDEAGGPGDDSATLSADDDILVVGRVINPCDETVILELPGTCLVTGFDLVDVATGEGDYEGLTCLDTARRTELAAGGSAETLLDWGHLPAGDYLLTAHFSVGNRKATTVFFVR